MDDKKEELNQCDGCKADHFLDTYGMHRLPNGYPIMVCQKHKYIKEKDNKPKT